MLLSQIKICLGLPGLGAVEPLGSIRTDVCTWDLVLAAESDGKVRRTHAHAAVVVAGRYDMMTPGKN